jgi:hypothetical protein
MVRSGKQCRYRRLATVFGFTWTFALRLLPLGHATGTPHRFCCPVSGFCRRSNRWQSPIPPPSTAYFFQFLDASGRDSQTTSLPAEELCIPTHCDQTSPATCSRYSNLSAARQFSKKARADLLPRRLARAAPTPGAIKRVRLRHPSRLRRRAVASGVQVLQR